MFEGGVPDLLNDLKTLIPSERCYLKGRWTCSDCTYTMEQFHALLLCLTQMRARCFVKKFPNASKFSWFRIPVPQLTVREWCGFKVQLKYPLVCPVSLNLCHCVNSWDWKTSKQNLGSLFVQVTLMYISIISWKLYKSGLFSQTQRHARRNIFGFTNLWYDMKPATSKWYWTCYFSN